MTAYQLPILYHHSKNGKVSEWNIFAEYINEVPHVTTVYGYQDGVKQTTSVKVESGKNLGRSNETTAWEQACLIAKSKWEKQKLGNYRESLEEEIKLLPMLAHKYQDNKNKVVFPCFVQPKLNGCLHHASKIQTNMGLLSLGDIVNNKLRVSVLSFNENTKTTEYKPVVNWFDNGESSTTEWVELQLTCGAFIKCTLDHKIFTRRGWVKASELNEEADQVLSSNSRLNTLLAGTIMGDSIARIEPLSNSYRLSFGHANKTYFDFKVGLLKLPGQETIRESGYGSKIYHFTSKALTKGSFPINYFYHYGYNFNEDHGKRCVVSYETLRNLMTLESISLWIGDDGSLRLNNNNPYTPVLQLAVMRYSEEQVEIFKQFFNSQKYQCNPTMIAFKKEGNLIGYSLNFNTKDSLYLLNQLRPLQCKGVEYKYYFPTEGYVQPAQELEFSTFKKKRIRHVNSGRFTKYDIEVEGNHNYFANGILVHNCRVLALIKENGVESWSRKGKDYETLDHWNSELMDTFPVGTVLDGEAFNPNLGFQEIIRRVKRVKTSRCDIKHNPLQYWIYDVVQTDKAFAARYEFLQWHFHYRHNQKAFKYLKLCDTLLIQNENDLEKIHKYNMRDGFEGTIIRSSNGIYRTDYRSYDLLKYKDFTDEEFKIIGGVSAQGKDEGTVVFECEVTPGVTFSVRPKGSFAQRKEYLDKLNQYIGQLLTVRYQEKSEDGVPIFPVGLAVRNYE